MKRRGFLGRLFGGAAAVVAAPASLLGAVVKGAPLHPEYRRWKKSRQLKIYREWKYIEDRVWNVCGSEKTNDPKGIQYFVTLKEAPDA